MFPSILLPQRGRIIPSNATTSLHTPQTFNVQEAEDACVGIKQQGMAVLHRDVVAILWHSFRKPAVSSRPPPAEMKGKAALEKF